MTGPNPDDELDKALGVTELPPAEPTDADWTLAAATIHGCHTEADVVSAVAHAIADTRQRAVARYVAEHAVAGTL